MRIGVWHILHDGAISNITGSIPGDVCFAIELEYVRSQFPDPGSAFLIRASGCDLLSFKSFSTDSTVHSVESLGALDLEILSAHEDGNALRIVTTDGVIALRYQSERMFLDSGRELTLDELAAAANRGARRSGHS